MNNLLKSVPAINKQELLFHIAEHFPATIISITTDSGRSYTGVVITIGKVRTDEAFLVLQVADDRNSLTTRFLHLTVGKIESIELINPADLVDMLSLGKVTKPETYEISGKLAVQRGFQLFSDAIFNAHAINVGVPAMELPADGLQLNRVLKLTQKIQQVIIDLLKEEDALSSWKARYNKISFINNDDLDVKGVNDQIEMHFAFNNINAPEISTEELTTLLMSIL
ncbi:hypothetical protein GO495_12360 [Chitinophaga oryziterrae]|uniref:Uncharacterized protein n=1 Tax=Chitinophaga oryziterrae TaxID=1031224 RepID=A0A6N8J820_9BACT|nr:hypothetical protein [Chitinophaga oryziterrae]MVT41380.1 hypothetical protein [Chitinophaga oryziterrae]